MEEHVEIKMKMKNIREKDEMKGGKDDERILLFTPNTALLVQHRTILQCPSQPAPQIYIYTRPRAL
jgi:hypothetical protein